MHYLYDTVYSEPYLLSLEVISDELNALGIRHFCELSGNNTLLKGVRFFQGDSHIMDNYLYLVYPGTEDSLPEQTFNSSLVFIGACSEKKCTMDAICIPENSPAKIFSILQDIFDKYTTWDRNLQCAISLDNPIEQMLMASLPIFGNPMFIHDNDFYVLDCPLWMNGMLQWETEARTGRKMVPMELINMFRTDEEYLNSLKYRESAVFSAGIRGYRILFANLWQQEHYRGRICIDELERPLRKSDYRHLNHLSKIVCACLEKMNPFLLSVGNEIDTLFCDLLSGKEVDTNKTNYYLRYMKWNPEDRFLILKIASDKEDYRAITPSSLLGYVESRISHCRALIYQQEIVVITNLSASSITISEIISSLAYILRDGMFKIGISSELNSISEIQYGFQQATIALSYGKRSNSMIWYYHFQDYALQFTIDSACDALPPHLLYSSKLKTLKKYDLENNTELYHTVEVYLKQERNAVATAKELFIHRSTLLYRLSRIEALSGIDFNNEAERLYLLLSLRMPNTNI